MQDPTTTIDGAGAAQMEPAPIRPPEEGRATRFQSFGGGLAVFASAFCFYFSTVVIRWSQAEVSIDPSYFVFVRFLLGFVVVCALMGARRQLPKPRRYHLLLGRTIGNCVAVFCFYNAVKYTTVAEANILNMTYPVFVAVISWVMLRQQRDPVAMAMVVVAFAGIWLILAPEEVAFKTANLWGLASGISASAAIVYLNISRRYHDTNTVLFFMFGIGAAIMLVAFHDRFFWPEGPALRYLLLCSVTGIAGQFLLTLGFRYVTAVEGSVISSMRILLAGVLGPFVAGEDALGVAGWVGGLILFGANTVLSLRRVHPKTPVKLSDNPGD
jgi:drug/metabolite transporter (DMT)-like permease